MPLVEKYALSSDSQRGLRRPPVVNPEFLVVHRESLNPW